LFPQVIAVQSLFPQNIAVQSLFPQVFAVRSLFPQVFVVATGMDYHDSRGSSSTSMHFPAIGPMNGP
jgi:hypothetical protein